MFVYSLQIALKLQNLIFKQTLRDVWYNLLLVHALASDCPDFSLLTSYPHPNLDTILLLCSKIFPPHSVQYSLHFYSN